MFEFSWGWKSRTRPFVRATAPYINKQLLLGIAGMGLAVALAACQPAGTSSEPPGAPSTDAGQTLAEAPSTPGPEDTLASATPEITDTVPVTPTEPPPTPTPRPTATPLPTPSAAVGKTATNLASQLAAFRAAIRERDMSTMLKLQRELMASADQAAQDLQNDQSLEADSVRQAIANIQKGVTGDNNALDHAEANLNSIASGQATGPSLGITVTTAPVDMDKLITSMREDLKNFQQALKDRKPEDALRLQGQLLNEMSQADLATKQDKTDTGSAIQAAIGSLRKGLDGDTESLAAASTALASLNGPANDPNQTNLGNQDVQRMASSLRSKLDDFTAAVAGNSRTDMLRLQQEIIAELDQDSSAIAADPSAEAKALKDAIDAVRSSVKGDMAKVDGARSALSKLAGDEQSQVTADGQKQPAPDLPRLATDMKDKVTSFQAALQKNDAGAMLQLQSDLLDQTAKADVAVKDMTSKPAEEMRAAIASLRTAFAGDTSKLDEALVHLNAVTGGGTAQTPGAPASNSGTPAAKVDLQPAANELRNQVNTLQGTTNSKNPNPDELAKQQAAVKEAAAKLSDALKGSNDPKADRLRAAVTAAMEAAGGDQAKIDAAKKLLDEALQ